MKSSDDFLRGYKIGLRDGKRDALIELQEQNQNTDLPSNETLYKIFELLFTVQANDEKTCSVYMNSYKHYKNYITTHWNE